MFCLLGHPIVGSLPSLMSNTLNTCAGYSIGISIQEEQGRANLASRLEGHSNVIQSDLTSKEIYQSNNLTNAFQRKFPTRVQTFQQSEVFSNPVIQPGFP